MNQQKAWPRIIGLVDMNAFFASIEQVDNPRWRGKPLAITNGEIGTCIITCSYAARAFGVKTGMHIRQARRICPELIQTTSRPLRYAEVSSHIMQALAEFTPVLEIFSVDEAFLDLSKCSDSEANPLALAKRIKSRVYEVSGVLSSIGISGDKTTAKYAAKLNKPDGLTIIPPWQSRQRLADAALTELCGVNQGIANMLAQHGVKTCGDVQNIPISVLGKRFGNPGRRIWLMAQGMDPEPVNPVLASPKSLGHGKVLPPNTTEISVILVFLRHMAHKLGERLRRHQLVAQQFLFGLRLYRGWLKVTLRSTLPCDDDQVIFRLGQHWIRNHWQGQGIWQIRVIALDPGQPRQADMFLRKRPQRVLSHQVMDSINQRYGNLTLAAARLVNRSSMPDVIAPSWKPVGHRKTV
ncbi:MAG: DNA polymerase IV [Gammaproteobacteria bacterium]|nr:DNA polymerase IV [Gammaproteobacteria bacterium]